MRLPHLRFTVRNMMIGVAVVGMLLGEGLLLWRTHVARWQMALVYSEKAQKEYRIALPYPPGHPIREYQARRGLSHNVVAAKYARAAYRPWESLP